ncbi:MAG: GNAT family N-acetyltransferase [Ruminococcus sp.]|nr:GNAT family N-acetyltransferase [Ruminococcus sp.]MDE6426894.1 GNAT family N-acetyltransferase [Ruminococcus sp.]MDE6500818.1 GNAT family N-acetyltransferase [Ruminococcus sp.]
MKKYIIRPAVESDADKIAELERLCFPVEEAASNADFADRLKVYAKHFLLLELDGVLIAMINGMVTDEPDLKDEMYHNAGMHNENGKWQMIFGLESHPDFRKQGYAALLIEKFIEEAKKQNRFGLVLTCKEILIHYYEKFGFVNEGISCSEHGNVVWYQMRKKLI